MRKIWRRGFLWVTGTLFLVSLAGQWTAGWFEFAQEQKDHGQSAEFKGYSIKMLRGTMENWQSEFLQLIWQVAGLSFLYYVGSPQSREGEERKEEKLDAILCRLDPGHAKEILEELNRKYPRQ